ncbi:MAG: ribosome maturation factor RimM [Magnetovibrionaceae bacterium]
MTGPNHADGQTSDRVCLGVITGVKGLRGRVRIKPFTAEPEGIAAYGPVSDEAGERRFKLTVREVAKGQVVCAIDGVTDRTQAEALKGLNLYVAADALPATDEEEFYYRDLIGLSAVTLDGRQLGQIVAVHDFGAGTFLEVKGPKDKGEALGTVMVPFTKAVVPVVSIADGRVEIDPPVGLLEPAPEEAKGEKSLEEETGEVSPETEQGK